MNSVFCFVNSVDCRLNLVAPPWWGWPRSWASRSWPWGPWPRAWPSVTHPLTWPSTSSSNELVNCSVITTTSRSPPCVHTTSYSLIIPWRIRRVLGSMIVLGLWWMARRRSSTRWIVATSSWSWRWGSSRPHFPEILFISWLLIIISVILRGWSVTVLRHGWWGSSPLLISHYLSSSTP